MNADEPRRRPGRPRNTQTDAAILQTARELVMEHGIHRFSMDMLAERSGISKPTIYRRWPAKDDLLADVLGYAAEQPDIPDTGHALTDLRQLLENMLQSLAVRLGAPRSAVHRMLAGMLDSDRFVSQYQRNFIEPRRAAYTHIIRRGKSRGEIQEDADEEMIVDLVSGAYFYCLLFKPEHVASGQWLARVQRILETGIGSTEQGIQG